MRTLCDVYHNEFESHSRSILHISDYWSRDHERFGRNFNLLVYYVCSLKLALKKSPYGIVRNTVTSSVKYSYIIFKEIVTLTIICAFGGMTSISISNGHLEDTVPLMDSRDQTRITLQVAFRKRSSKWFNQY